MYSVGEIKKLTGLSARTLQYYDEICLLKPSSQTEANYRLYDEALEKLQQIMFFKELGFSLSEIKMIMEDTDFDKIQAYRKQKELLQLKKNRIDRLINLLERLEKGEQCMSFKEFDLTDYILALGEFRKENEAAIIKYWGGLENFDLFVDKIKENEDEVARLAIKQFGSIESYTKEMKKNLDNFSEIMDSKMTDDVNKIGQDRDVIFRKITKNLSADVSSNEVQLHVKELIKFISKHGGESLEKDIGRTLLDSYKSDYVKQVTDREYGEGATEFASRAIEYYTENGCS